jgi:hypothetical protein
VHAGVRQIGEIDADGAGDSDDVTRQPGFFGGDGFGRTPGADGEKLRHDRRIEDGRGIGECGLERLRIERGGLPGGVGQSGRRGSVAAQGGDPGEPAQGAGNVVGRG